MRINKPLYSITLLIILFLPLYGTDSILHYTNLNQIKDLDTIDHTVNSPSICEVHNSTMETYSSIYLGSTKSRADLFPCEKEFPNCKKMTEVDIPSVVIHYFCPECEAAKKKCLEELTQKSKSEVDRTIEKIKRKEARKKSREENP